MDEIARRLDHVKQLALFFEGLAVTRKAVELEMRARADHLAQAGLDIGVGAADAHDGEAASRVARAQGVDAGPGRAHGPVDIIEGQPEGAGQSALDGLRHVGCLFARIGEAEMPFVGARPGLSSLVFH